MAKHLRHARCLLFYLVFIVSTLFSNSKSLQSIVFYLLCIAISCNPKLFHSIQLQRANTGDVFKRITGRIPLARVSSSFFAWGERNLSLLYGNHFRLEDHKSWTPHSIFQRISNASGQCAVPHHYARSFPVKASPDFATHEFQPLLPPFVPQRFLLLINRRDWNSRYLDIFYRISYWIIERIFISGNYEKNFYTILFSHDDSNLRARENLFIYIPPSWYFRRITSSRCISAMIYAQFRGKEFRGGKFTRAERVNPFGWKWTTVPPQPLPPEW